MNIAPPAIRTFQALQHWFEPVATGESGEPKRNPPFDETSVLNKLFFDSAVKEGRFSYKSEIMTLHAPAEEDYFSTLIAWWGRSLSCLKVVLNWFAKVKAHS